MRCTYIFSIYINPIVNLNILFLISVHGNWAEWSDWGDCTVTCGGGQRRRFRTCTNPSPKHHGRPCIGNSQVTETCNTDRCAGKITEYIGLLINNNYGLRAGIQILVLS